MLPHVCRQHLVPGQACRKIKRSSKVTAVYCASHSIPVGQALIIAQHQPCITAAVVSCCERCELCLHLRLTGTAQHYQLSSSLKSNLSQQGGASQQQHGSGGVQGMAQTHKMEYTHSWCTRTYAHARTHARTYACTPSEGGTCLTGTQQKNIWLHTTSDSTVSNTCQLLPSFCLHCEWQTAGSTKFMWRSHAKPVTTKPGC